MPAGPLTFALPFITLEISYYRLFLVIALCVTVSTALWLIKKSGLDFKRSSATLASATLAFFVGARLLNAAIRPGLYLAEPWRFVSLEATGFSLYGGLAAAIIAILIMARRLKINLWKFGDAAAPAFGLGLAVMRLGCFLNGCCFGKPTALPWGVTYPLFREAHLWQMSHGLTGPFQVLPVHPTQLYEAAYSLIGAAISFWLWKKKTKPGTAAIFFTLWLTTFRLGNHYLRALPYDDWVTVYLYPMIYTAIILACIVMLRKKICRLT